MGSYGQDEDLDEYEDDFIDDPDGDVGVKYRYDDEDDQDDQDDEEEEEYEEVEEEPVSQEALELLKYRQQLKEQLRYKMRKEEGGGFVKSQDKVRRPSNFGSFFGPSQPVIADRVVQQSKALLETRHLAPKASTSKASTSQNNGKVNMPSNSGQKNGLSRPPPASQVKTVVQKMKHARDYSFLLSDDADVPKPMHKDPGQHRTMAPKPDSRPAQVSSQRNIPSGHPGRKAANGYEQRKPHGNPQARPTSTAPIRKLTSGNEARVSSDPRRQQEMRKHSQPTKQVGSSTGNASARPPLSRGLPTKKPSSSADRRMPIEKKASSTPGGYRDKGPLVPPKNVPNGQRRPIEKPRTSGVIRPSDRHINGQLSKGLLKENVAYSKSQVRPPMRSIPQARLDRDNTRPQKAHGLSSAPQRSQTGSVRRDPPKRKRPEPEDEPEEDYRSVIRGMFGYDPRKHMHDDDDVSDMEADFSSIQREERRSAVIAKREDEEEYAKIMEEERQERLRKKAKMRKMSQR